MSEPTNFAQDLKARASVRLYNAVMKKCSGGKQIGPEHTPRIVAVTEFEWGLVRGMGKSMIEQLADIFEDWDLVMGTGIPSPEVFTSEKELVVLDERAILLAEARDECREHLEIIKTRRLELPNGGFDPMLTAGMNTIAKSISQLNAEARQQEKHEAAVIENLSDDQQDDVVKDFLENISKVRRRKIVDWASDLDIGTGLLGH